MLADGDQHTFQRVVVFFDGFSGFVQLSSKPENQPILSRGLLAGENGIEHSPKEIAAEVRLYQSNKKAV